MSTDVNEVKRLGEKVRAKGASLWIAQCQVAVTVPPRVISPSLRDVTVMCLTACCLC